MESRYSMISYLRIVLFVLLFPLVCVKETAAQWMPTFGLDDGPDDCIAVVPNNSGGENVLTGYYSNIFILDSNKTNWKETSGVSYENANTRDFAVICNENGEIDLFALTMWSILHSADNGFNWENLYVGVYGQSCKNIAALPGRNGGTLFITGDRGIYKTTKEGSGWLMPYASGLEGLVVADLAVSGINLLAATNSGIFRSSDSGTSWKKVSDKRCRKFAVSGQRIYAAFPGSNHTGEIYLSTDSGLSWNLYKEFPLSHYYPEASGVYLYVFAASGKSLFLGTFVEGLFLLKDKDSSWISINEGIAKGNSFIYSLAVSSTDAYVGTWNGDYKPPLNGIVYRRPLSEMISMEDTGNNEHDTDIRISDQYLLRPNYPNPFNPNTTISYAIPKKSMVQLKVYNILGCEVTTLVEKEQSAGEYEVQFNGTSLSSGVYIYRMRAGEFSDSRKLVLIK